MSAMQRTWMDAPPAAMGMASVLLVAATVSLAFLDQSVRKVSAQIFSRGMGNAGELCRGHIPFLPVLLSPPLPFLFISFQGSMRKSYCILELPEHTFLKKSSCLCKLNAFHTVLCTMISMYLYRDQNECCCHAVKAVKSFVN